VEPPAEPLTPRRHRRRHWALLGVTAAVVAAVAAAGLLVLLQREPGPASIDDAVDDFTGADDPGTDRTPRPPEGVYVYEGEGAETLSILPGDHGQGPRMPATVTHTPNGCWRFRIDLHEAHWQDWRYCPDGGDLVERGGRTYQSWDLGIATVDSTSTFRCPDSVVARSDAEPGDGWRQECRGTSDSLPGVTISAGRTTFVGAETVAVADEDVPALHYRQVRRMSGIQTGEQTEDFWFRASDGLPVRNTRSTSVDSDSRVGAITYSEAGEWRLTSPEPRT